MATKKQIKSIQNFDERIIIGKKWCDGYLVSIPVTTHVDPPVHPPTGYEFKSISVGLDYNSYPARATYYLKPVAQYGSKFNSYLPYVLWVVDDAGNGRKIGSDIHATVDEKTVLVVYQCGFEPAVVAVKSYLDCRLDSRYAEDLAQDYLLEIGWLKEPTDCDYIVRSYH